MRLIINADDLGYSPAVNDAIFKLMARGKVTSATLLTGGVAFGDAVSRLHEFPACSFGVHLNLTELTPLTHQAVWHDCHLLDADGNFNAAIRAARPSYRLLKTVIEEWSAQIEAAQKAGVPVSHLDSHHHVHTIPWLFPALKSVQRRYGIRKVRSSLNLYARNQRISRHLALSKRLWNYALRRILRTATTDYFTHLPWLLEQAPLRPELTGKDIEVMVHPGALDYADETRLLDLDLKELAPQIELISYRGLHG